MCDPHQEEVAQARQTGTLHPVEAARGAGDHLRNQGV
jgi:hypothetical protein